MRNVLLFTLILFCHFGVLSQRDTIAVSIDENSVLADRPTLEDLSKKYTGDDYNYDVKTGESQNLLGRFFRWLNSWMSDTFGIKIPPAVYDVLKWVIYILMSGVIIYLIIRLVTNQKLESIFTKKAKSVIDIELTEQHIEQIDFDSLLSNAIKEKNYRLAVRYEFLRFLKRLSQKDIIDWNFEKTNLDYQNEIGEEDLKRGFKNLAYVYDYVWYGEQAIDEISFAKVNAQFKSMNQKIPR